MNGEIRQELVKINIPLSILDNLAVDYNPLTSQQEECNKAIEQIIKGELQTITLLGTQGTGKTFLACSALVRYCIDQFWSKGQFFRDKALYTKHYNMELAYKSAMSPATTQTQEDVFYRFARQYKLLVIDELGRGKNSEYTMSFIENVIAERYEQKLPTIIISNKTAKEFKVLIDSPIIDRLRSKNGRIFDFEGESLR